MHGVLKTEPFCWWQKRRIFMCVMSSSAVDKSIGFGLKVPSCGCVNQRLSFQVQQLTVSCSCWWWYSDSNNTCMWDCECSNRDEWTCSQSPTPPILAVLIRRRSCFWRREFTPVRRHHHMSYKVSDILLTLCARVLRFVVIWKHFCSILSMGTKIRIDSVMHPRSSSTGCNTSASVTVTCKNMPYSVL